MIANYIYIAIGGAIGAVLRYAIGQWQHSNSLPWHTLIINVLGSTIIGCIFALLQQQKITQQTYLFAAIGLCGGFTTFSSFSLENMQFLQNQLYTNFILYSLLSVGTCIIGTFAGYKILKAFYS